MSFSFWYELIHLSWTLEFTVFVKHFLCLKPKFFTSPHLLLLLDYYLGLLMLSEPFCWFTFGILLFYYLTFSLFHFVLPFLISSFTSVASSIFFLQAYEVGPHKIIVIVVLLSTFLSAFIFLLCGESELSFAVSCLLLI